MYETEKEKINKKSSSSRNHILWRLYKDVDARKIPNWRKIREPIKCSAKRDRLPDRVKQVLWCLAIQSTAVLSISCLVKMLRFSADVRVSVSYCIKNLPLSCCGVGHCSLQLRDTPAAFQGPLLTRKYIQDGPSVWF
jgi:hypothetical protein